MENYKLVAPKEYLPEHIELIEKFKDAILLLSIQTNDIMGIKDIDSQHITSTDTYASIIGLKHGVEVEGRTDYDMPCSGTVEFAEQYIKEDRSLLNSQRLKSGISILNVHHYADGLKARIFKKRILHHVETKSILGTIYSGFDVELKDFISIMPNYIIQFGSIGSIEAIQGSSIDLPLNEYEQEICFLLLLNWEFKQIAEFMNIYRPETTSRTADTIIKKRNYICYKLKIDSIRTSDLCDFLIYSGFHKKLPQSFYSRIIGSQYLGEEPVIT